MNGYSIVARKKEILLVLFFQGTVPPFLRYSICLIRGSNGFKLQREINKLKGVLVLQATAFEVGFI